jgi:hypothetical protein
MDLPPKLLIEIAIQTSSLLRIQTTTGRKDIISSEIGLLLPTFAKQIVCGK